MRDLIWHLWYLKTLLQTISINCATIKAAESFHFLLPLLLFLKFLLHLFLLQLLQLLLLQILQHVYQMDLE